MSRHRRAAPSISAAAPTAPRLRSAFSNGPAWPGLPRTAAPVTGVPSSVTLARRVAGSIICAGSSVSPAAPGSTRDSESPSQPSWAISFHVASLSPRGSSQRRRTAAGVMCSSRNARAEFFRSCWSGLNAKSTASRLQAVGAHFLGQAEDAFADDVLLDLGRARVDLAQLGAHDGVLEERSAAAPQFLGRSHELAEGDRVARDAPERVGAALVAERGLRDRPSLVEAADEVARLGARVGHEDLGEERGAGDL